MILRKRLTGADGLGCVAINELPTEESIPRVLDSRQLRGYSYKDESVQKQEKDYNETIGEQR